MWLAELLKDYAEQGSSIQTAATCEAPRELHGRSIITLTAQEFNCGELELGFGLGMAFSIPFSPSSLRWHPAFAFFLLLKWGSHTAYQDNANSCAVVEGSSVLACFLMFFG